MAEKVVKLRVSLRLSSGLMLDKEWGEREVLPEGLRGRVVPPSWIDNPQRRERPGGLTILEGQVQSGHESDAAHWMGLE